MRIKALHLVLAIAAILGAASGASALAVSASHGVPVATAAPCSGPTTSGVLSHAAPMDGSGDGNGTGTNDSQGGENETGDGPHDNSTGDDSGTGSNDTQGGENETGDSGSGGNSSGDDSTGSNDSAGSGSGASCGTDSPSPDAKGSSSTGRDL